MQHDSHVAIRVWDLPVRVLHWALVLLLAFQVATGLVGGELMAWHLYSGYCVMVLLFFRVLWGFVGSTHARFASFIAGPGAAFRFAKRLLSREAVPQVGHNPLGGWMVIALLASLAVQVASGLFAYDGLFTEGPLSRLVSFDLANRLSEIHRWNYPVLLALSGVHLAAVLFHWLVKREDLIQAMFTGVKHVPEAAVRERREGLRRTPLRRAASRENAAAWFAGPWRALGVLAVAAGSVYLVVNFQ